MAVLKFEKATSTARGKKIFLARLKKFADEGKTIVYGKTRGRFDLNSNFRTKVALRKAKGLETKASVDHAILKKSFNPKKPMTKNKKNSRAKTAKGKEKNSKKLTKVLKEKDSKRKTKAAANKTKKDQAAKGAAGKGRSTSKAKGKTNDKSKSPAKGRGRVASKSPAKGK